MRQMNKKRMKPTVKKAFFAFAVLIMSAGIYGGVIALANNYLRTHGMLTPTTKFIIGVALALGLILIYRGFSRQLDKISGQ